LDRALLESCYTPAASQALESFPVEVDDIKLVAHSENVTFRVSVRGSDMDYTLRLHRPGYNTFEELESERAWTRALHEAGIPVPESLLTSHGEHYALIDIPGAGEQRYAGLTTWLEGMPLDEYLKTGLDKKEQQRIFHRIGEITAAIHNQSTDWKEPPGFARRRLDLEGLLGEEPAWGRFWEHRDLSKTERKLLLRARAAAHSALIDYGIRPGNFSLIHADLHPANIVRNGKNLALIDFDDAAYGWHMYDIASALNEDKLNVDIEATCTALLEGYRLHRPLADQDIDMLHTFLVIRGLALIGWYHQRPEHDGSRYFEEIKDWVLDECRSHEK